MAPTWAGPGLFIYKNDEINQKDFSLFSDVVVLDRLVCYMFPQSSITKQLATQLFHV